MPWFNVDDSAHGHPKIIRAGNAAFGLWARCGSYVAQHLTDGIVPGPVAEMYGSAPQIKKLVSVGLWHASGHGCASCPQPGPGDFYMHDYTSNGNPMRAEVLAKRARAAEKKRRQREEFEARNARRSPRRQPPPPDGPSLFDDDPGSFPTPDFREDAGQDDVSRGDSPAPSPGTAPRPIPADWTPSHDDVQAAQIARSDADRDPLTTEQLDLVTRKFVRRQLDDRRTAASWGGRWRQWAENERTDDGAAGGVVVQFGQQSKTKGQQQREGLARLLQQQTREV